ncbi:MAG: hypothetical protein BGP06_04355 [Rhizobiales bacterium 65-9]|nr:MAG: hypothetical protein BGP06_04355 [Rhizobiales bacterium 65-9]
MTKLAVLCIALALCGCTASVTTFSADFSSPPREGDARAACAAELRGRSATSQITIGPGGGASAPREQMSLCLRRRGY